MCIVAGSDANFARLCAAMGRTDLVDDPRWQTLARRAEGSATRSTAWWPGGWRRGRAAEIEAVCIEHGVPVATISDAADILADPHVAARGDLVTVDDPVAGPHLQQAPFPRLDGMRPRSPAPAPALGQHNLEVWGDLVGLSTDEVDRLAGDGVL